MSTPHRRHSSRGTRNATRYLMAAVAVVVALGASVWLVIAPTAGSENQAGAEAPPTSTPAGTHAATNATSPGQAKATTHSAPTTAKATTTPSPKPWKYRDECPDTALACVDLKDKVTWLQHGGVVFYGPVPMNPGAPQNPTPTGTYQVQYKDRHHVSNEYNEPMPYAVFFAPGGIAFHEGSLKTASHGCVHLTWQDAAYYFENLPDGAQVVVF